MSVYNEANLDISGTHLIEASAGTGKTYTVQGLLVRLLVEHGLPVSSVLVVTFTRKAAAELRERCHAALASTLRWAEGVAPANDRYQSLAESLFGALQAKNIPTQTVLDRLRAAIHDFDQAQISTIHAFCQHILRQHRTASGVADYTFVEDDALGLNRYAADWWRIHLAANAAQPVSFTKLLEFVKELSGRPDAEVDPAWEYDNWQSSPRPDNNPADREPKYNGWYLHAAKEIVEEHRRSLAQSGVLTFDTLLQVARDALFGGNGDAFARAVRQEFKAAIIDEFQDTNPVQYDIFRKVFADTDPPTPLFFVGDPKQAIYGFRGGDVYCYVNAKREIPKDHRHTLDTNFRATEGVLQAVNTMFRDRDGGRTFTLDGIDYPVDIQYGGQTQPLRIDGQDDNPNDQFQFRVAEGEKSEEIRQSARNDIVRQIQRALSRNQAGETAWTIPDGNGGHRNIKPSDFAVLVRSNKEGVAVQKAFEAAGIQSIRLGDDSVFNAPIAETFLQWMRAVADPDGFPSVRHLLMTPLFGIAPGRVKCLANGGRIPFGVNPQTSFGDFVKRCRDLRAIWEEDGLAAAVAAFRATPGLPALTSQDQIDFDHLAELVQRTIVSQNLGPEETVLWFESKIEDDEESGEESLDEDDDRRVEVNDSTVTVMTIHKSKGLERPIVFLPDAWLKGGGRKEPNIKFYHVLENDQWRLRAAATGTEWENEQAQERMRLLYVAFTRAKQRCVAYAPPRTPIMALKNRQPVRIDSEEFDTLRRRLNRDVQLTPDDIDGPADENPPGNVNQEDATPNVPAFATGADVGSFSSLNPGSGRRNRCSDDFHDVDDEGTPDASDSPRGIFTIPGGESTGLAWHAILEHVSFQADLDALQQACDLHGVRQDHRQMVCNMLHRVLSQLHLSDGQNNFHLSEIADGDRFSEWEFSFSSRSSQATTAAVAAVLRQHWGNDPNKREFLKALRNWDKPIPRGWLTGFIDVVVRHGNRYSLLDWKSNKLRDPRSFSRDGISMAMAEEGYFLQYLLYATALHWHLKETLPDYSYNRNFGSVHYVFLRGALLPGHANEPVNPETCLYSDRPSEALLDDLAVVLGLSPIENGAVQ